MKPQPTHRVLILADPFSRPSFIPRLRFLCDYMVDKGWQPVVYTEAFEAHDFPHAYPIHEKPLYYSRPWQWLLLSAWSLLTDWRNRMFSRWVREQVKDEEFDLVFCTTFSTFPLRAALDVARDKHLPLIVDIRDLDEQVPDSQSQAHRQWWARPFRTIYRDTNARRRNSVLRQADCITTVSPWHVEFLRQFNRNVHLIYNGYAPDRFYYRDTPADEFLITYIGRIFEFQSTALIEQVVAELALPDMRLNIHTPEHRPIPMQAAGDEIRRSSIILVLTNPSAHGMMTTKFFEALGCEKPVLCIPSDESILAQTIRETNAGIASSDAAEIKAFILDKYHEWQAKGYTRQAVTGKEQFSRAWQAEQFIRLFQAQ